MASARRSRSRWCAPREPTRHSRSHRSPCRPGVTVASATIADKATEGKVTVKAAVAAPLGTMTIALQAKGKFAGAERTLRPSRRDPDRGAARLGRAGRARHRGQARRDGRAQGEDRPQGDVRRTRHRQDQRLAGRLEGRAGHRGRRRIELRREGRRRRQGRRDLGRQLRSPWPSRSRRRITRFRPLRWRSRSCRSSRTRRRGQTARSRRSPTMSRSLPCSVWRL